MDCADSAVGFYVPDARTGFWWKGSFYTYCHHACTMWGKACPRSGMSDIIARISYLIFSHYLANIVYCDINGISRYLYDIWICPDVWVFSVLDNRLLSEIWVILQKCQFGRAEKDIYFNSNTSPSFNGTLCHKTNYVVITRFLSQKAVCWIYALF